MHNKLGKRLKELRVEKNLSQKALAEIIETNNSSVCDWECGRTEPSLDTVIKLCEFFDVTADYLLGISDY
ncbi:MAG: helix-turn-helix domain-containing protein [Clostridiales bacterium]|nr:helix-turn-helix domain-containing protein [Clostridiales bacterium]